MPPVRGSPRGLGPAAMCGAWRQPTLWERGGQIQTLSLGPQKLRIILNFEQKDSAITCAFRPCVPSAEEPQPTLLGYSPHQFVAVAFSNFITTMVLSVSSKQNIPEVDGPIGAGGLAVVKSGFTDSSVV